MIRKAVAATLFTITFAQAASSQQTDSARVRLEGEIERLVQVTRELAERLQRTMAQLAEMQVRAAATARTGRATDDLRRQEAAAAVEYARLRVASGAATGEELARAQRMYREVDSAIVDRALALYRMRAITRRDFETTVGLLRADSLIRAMRDTASSATLSQRLADSAARQAVERELAARIVSDRISAIGVREAMVPAVSLGIGLSCAACSISSGAGGATVWNFTSYPVVASVEARSIAERLGLQRGDTLRAIDGVAINTREGSERLSNLRPGSTVRLEWRRGGNAMSASAAIPPDRDSGATTSPRATLTAGDRSVTIRGRGAVWTQDPRTGELRISGDSIEVVIGPARGR
jgi:hypothetical protein